MYQSFVEIKNKSFFFNLRLCMAFAFDEIRILDTDSGFGKQVSLSGELPADEDVRECVVLGLGISSSVDQTITIAVLIFDEKDPKLRLNYESNVEVKDEEARICEET